MIPFSATRGRYLYLHVREQNGKDNAVGEGEDEESDGKRDDLNDTAVTSPVWFFEERAEESDTQIIIVTHSSHFVPMSHLSQCVHVSGKDGRPRAVNLGKIAEPLMRLGKANRDFSQILFSESVLFCEGPDDQALYSRCIAEASGVNGIPSVVLFSGGKSLLPEAISVARYLGIRFVAVADGDLLADDGRSLSKVFSALGLSQPGTEKERLRGCGPSAPRSRPAYPPRWARVRDPEFLPNRRPRSQRGPVHVLRANGMPSSPS